MSPRLSILTLSLLLTLALSQPHLTPPPIDTLHLSSPSPSPILSHNTLDFHWATEDPFLFCAYHNDYYPAGNNALGIDKAKLKGRNIGSDFIVKDGYRMYHGDTVPGFPGHPHRGFETVTVVLDGFIDHADSLGCQGRYGDGDVQWMTAGKGVQHAEMFPLLNEHDGNHLELFQIWINLPAKDKMVDPEYKMLWRENIPVVREIDDEGRETKIVVVAGRVGDVVADQCTTRSWAADEQNGVSIYIISMDAKATWTLPLASAFVNRKIFFFEGTTLEIHSESFNNLTGISLHPEIPTTITMGTTPGRILLLEGKPISEPISKHGPFVMNTREEIQQAFTDYQQTQFGGWPWSTLSPSHPRHQPRFATFPNGKIEMPK